MQKELPTNQIIFKPDTAERKRFFKAASFAHPAKMILGLQIYLIENYTKPGDTILDPMAGSGTALIACTLGRNVILVELEGKFVKMQEDNWAKIKSLGPMLGHTLGQATILQGDARNLDGMLADNILFSPPYAEVTQKLPDDYHIPITGSPLSKGTDAVKLAKYSESENNIGNLPYGAIDAVISSPPYAETGVGDWKTGRDEFQKWVLDELATKGYVEWQGKRYNESEWRALNHGRLDGRTTKGVHKHPTNGYGKENGQIGNLPYGKADAVITSPPYEGMITRKPCDKDVDNKAMQIGGKLFNYNPDNKDNIGNLKSENYLSAMAQVYEQCRKVLKPDGVMCIVVKNFIRDKKIVRLDTDTIKLCEQAGFKLKERLERKLTQQSFWRTIYKQRFPDAPEIKHEDILIFSKEAE